MLREVHSSHLQLLTVNRCGKKFPPGAALSRASLPGSGSRDSGSPNTPPRPVSATSSQLVPLKPPLLPAKPPAQVQLMSLVQQDSGLSGKTSEIASWIRDQDVCCRVLHSVNPEESA